MESSSSDYYNKDNEEESLLANVASLRHELKITEWNLQSLGEELSSVSPSENSENISNPSRSERLILEDLVQPGHSELSNYSPFKKICKMAGSSTDFQKKPRDKVSMLESAQQQAANVPILEEQIINLEAEVSAQDKVLREAENKLEQSQKMVIEKEQSLQQSKEECIKLKVDLLEQTKQGKSSLLWPGKTVEDGSSAWAPVPAWETRKKHLAPGF